jgi:4-diphosphocytidyl-2C-methyl-D-erythritol kinase
MLAKTCFALNNKLALLKTEIENICHFPASLSGSGSALFVLLADKDYRKAECLRREIECLLDCNCIIVFNNQW